MKNFLIIILLAFISCTKSNNIPSYISISDIELNSSNISGANTENISDVWFYINDSLQGIYELPASFPVLNRGVNNIRVKGGVKANGISSTRIAYPFFTSYFDTINFIEDQNIVLNPIIEYNTSFNYIIEDFEGSGTIVDSTLSSEIDFSIKSDDNGNNYAYARLDTPYINFEVALDDLVLPQQGANVYLELDYKCNVEFQIGVYSNFNQQVEKNDLLFVTAKDQWSKVYVNLTPIVSSSIGANTFKIYINQRRPTNTSFAEIFFDNIKIIY